MLNLEYNYKNKYSRICIDQNNDGIIAGRLINDCFENEFIAFNGIFEMISGLETIMDDSIGPKAYEIIRSFNSDMEDYNNKKFHPIVGNPMGQINTFDIRVIARKNCTWQGTIVWVEEQKEECFRSVLELIHLINSAL